MVNNFPRSHGKSMAELRLKLYLFEAKAQTYSSTSCASHRDLVPGQALGQGTGLAGRTGVAVEGTSRELKNCGPGSIHACPSFICPPFARRQVIDQHQPDSEGKITALQIYLGTFQASIHEVYRNVHLKSRALEEMCCLL